MIRLLRWGFGLGALLLALVGLAGAEPPTPGLPPAITDDDTPGPEKNAKEIGTPASKTGAPGSLKDPTSPSSKMREILAKKGTTTGAAPRLSPLALRGRVIARDKPPAVLLEVDGKLYTVATGSVLAGPNNTTLRVLDITSSEVRIQFDPLKEIVVLR